MDDFFERFLLSVVYDVPSLIFVVDATSGTIIYTNRFMRQSLGEDCVGRAFSKQFASAGGSHYFISYSRVSPRESGAVQGEIIQQSEYYDDESENWYHVLQRPITWYDGTPKIAFVLNQINTLKRLQNDLSEAHANLALKNRELEVAAKTDRLTQLSNRHHLDVIIAQEFARSRRTRNLFSVLIADCDQFKSINDTYGHQVGDLVLIDIARLLRTSVRVTDTVGRWGGEEFLVILPDTGLENAVQVAEKQREVIDAQEFPTVGHTTVSFGVAELRPDETIKDLIARADEALYRAKKNGRNRVEVSG